MVAPVKLFDLPPGHWSAELFGDLKHVWDVLERIKDFAHTLVQRHGSTARIAGVGMVERLVVIHGGQVVEGARVVGGAASKGEFKVEIDGRVLTDAVVIYPGAVLMDERVHLGPGTVVEPGALIAGPTYVEGNAEIRQGAYVRGGCIVGSGCVVGHTTEMKNAVMLPGAKAGHFAYIGDSVLGRDTNLGAGTKLANLKVVPGPVRIRVGPEVHELPRRKVGAILGDKAQTGCNSVTNPGTVLGRRVIVAACKSVAPGYYPDHSVVR